METKDLVLLMLIPIMLVSLIIYTDKNPTITGAVTTEQKENNIIGTYSINPSFKAKTEYDLDDYSKIKKSFDVVSNCAQSKDIQSCINDVNDNDHFFTWSLGCDKGPEKVLYGFAEFLQDCIDSENSNCLCRKQIDVTKEDIQSHVAPYNEYKISLAEDIALKRIDMSIPEFPDLSYSVKTRGISGWMPKIVSLGYTLDGLTSYNLFFINEIGDTKYSFGPIRQITIYKHNINGMQTIDFVDDDAGILIYPNRKQVTENSKQIETANLKECQIKPKNIYKFCVIKKDYKIMAHDKIDGQMKERSLTVKFAAYIPPQQNP